MKNILMLAHDDPGQKARLQAALDLTRAFSGHLTCLDITGIPLVIDETYSRAVEAEFFVQELAAHATFRKRVEGQLEREDVPWTWIEGKGTLDEILAQHAGLADLIIVSRRLDTARWPNMRSIASEVVVGTDRTVVAVPEEATGFHVAGRALVAWDGSKEAMNALQAALPLLALARHIRIVHVDDGRRGTSAEEAAAYLSRHGIKPTIVETALSTAPTSEMLIAYLTAEEADYIVLGGFGHSRMLEAVFGGVSREMLTASPVPVVMKH